MSRAKVEGQIAISAEQWTTMCGIHVMFYQRLAREHLLGMRIVFGGTWLGLGPILLVLASCANVISPAVNETQTNPAPSASTVVEYAQVTMGAASSFRFRLVHEHGSTTLSGGLSLRDVEGKVVMPDRIALVAGANLGRAFVTMELVVLGDITYMTNPLTGNWSQISRTESPISFFDPAALIADILNDLDDPYYLFSDTPNIRRIRGTVGAEAFAVLVPDVDETRTLDVVLELDGDSYAVNKVEITGSVSDTEASNIRRVFEFWDINEPLNVDAPI